MLLQEKDPRCTDAGPVPEVPMDRMGLGMALGLYPGKGYLVRGDFDDVTFLASSADGHEDDAGVRIYLGDGKQEVAANETSNLHRLCMCLLLFL